LSADPELSAASVQTPAQGRSEDIRAALWLGLALFFFYLLTTSGHLPYGDEAHYPIVAENLLTRGRPFLTEQTLRQTNGQSQSLVTYSRLPLGQSLLILPFAAVEIMTNEVLPAALSFIPHLVINSLPAAEAAAICALLFLLIRLTGRFQPELYLSPGAAMAGTLTMALATQMWPSSRTLFADTSAAFLLTLAIYSLVRFRYENAGVGWVQLAAWAAALAVLCKYVFILTAPALAAYGLWAVIERKKKTATSDPSLLYLIWLAALPFILVAVTQLWFNYLRYDSIWLSGYHERREGELGFATPLLVGLYGILLSSGRSLFLYSPPCLLAFFGARKFLTWARAETALIAGVSLPLLFTYAKWWAWDGGWEWGNRFHLFLIPLLMWLSAPAWRWMDEKLVPTVVRRTYQISLALLLALSVYVQALGLLIHPATYWKLAGKEVPLVVLERGYEKGVWEIRDDMFLAHFVPEFSPLAAHHWLVWATWNQSRLDEATLAAGAPWVSLNAKWAPKNVRPYLGFDLWFLRAWPQEEKSTAYAIVAEVLLAILASLCAIKLSFLIRRSP
jgi:4-amino-4-deoxy-L-arabinose transferase-like glycosyltransferase